MGDWIYYSCLMDMKTLANRVHYAGTLHKHDGLSTMIQRHLDDKRRTTISDYIRDQPQRFFNSLVLATYGGDPSWISLAGINNPSDELILESASPETISSIGFLILRGNEKLFAVDGQHRLAGIKKAVEDHLDQDPYDEVAVIVVAHRQDSEGLERTRRLFTTLNKTARPVSKGDIIALDEDDVMAICVRRLVDTSELFAGPRLAFVAGNNMPASNKKSMTTIGNLYDVLSILFTKCQWCLRKPKASLQRIRPEEKEIDEYFRYSVSFFDALRSEFHEIREFVESGNSECVVEEYRGRHGGKVLFRPLGLELFATVTARLTEDMDLERAVRAVAHLPRNLHEQPFEGVLWSSKRNTIIGGNKVLLRELLCYMLNKNSERFPENVLLEEYRRATGVDSIKLPGRVL